jgi:DNA-binding transcriptional regulator YhcF (GntR family)
VGPGDDLPSLRAAANQYKTTSSAIGRASRHLADAGVIELADRGPN